MNRYQQTMCAAENAARAYRDEIRQRVERFYETHPENLYQVTEVSDTGIIRRDKTVTITPSDRHKQNWFADLVRNATKRDKSLIPKNAPPDCRIIADVPSTDPETGETWRDIPRMFGVYQASNFGRIRSLKTVVNVLVTYPVKGRLAVCIRIGSSSSSQYVHKLVYMAFCDDTIVPRLDFLDGDVTNCRPENLAPKHVVITPELASAIRTERIGSYTHLARKYHISASTVGRIMRGEAYNGGE